MNMKKILSVLTIIAFVSILFLWPKQSSAYYNYNGIYGLGFQGSLGGGIYGTMFGLFGSGGFGGPYGLTGLGSPYGLTGLNGLGRLYSLGSFGNFSGLGGFYGLYGLGSSYGLFGQGGLGGFYGLGSSGSIYSAGNTVGTYGLGGSYGLFGLAGPGLNGLNLSVNAGLSGGLGQINSAATMRMPAALTTGTWTGQWLSLQAVPIPAIPVTSGISAGPVALTLAEDLALGTADGTAIFELNTYLSGGIELSGTISFALLTLNGIVQAPLVPGGLLNVNIECIRDTPTHMTGDYQVYDFFGGYYTIYEKGTLELELLPSII